MKIKSQLITLNSRQYIVHDMGEGEAVFIIQHQCITPATPLQLMMENKKKCARMIIIDVTHHLPSEVSLLTPQQISALIDDLHLLCDIYWLDTVEVHSYYCPDVVQKEMKKRLGRRVIAPLLTPYAETSQ